jgi:hypothetical protein
MAGPGDYAKEKVTELRAELKSRGLVSSGKKAELIQKLEEDDLGGAGQPSSDGATASAGEPVLTAKGSGPATMAAILPKLKELTQELEVLRPSQVRRKAASAGIRDEELDDALDSEDPKAALIALVVSKEETALQKAAQTKAAESKYKKMVVRSVSASAMFLLMYGTLYAGHGWVCAIALLVQAEIFREMVNVRYGQVKRVATASRHSILCCADSSQGLNDERPVAGKAGPIFSVGAVELVCCSHGILLR